MVTATTTLVNSQGLHMLPAGVLASAMRKFDGCDVTIIYGDKQQIDAKSPMALMASGLQCGAKIEIACNGKGEQEALDTAIHLIETGLGESARAD